MNNHKAGDRVLVEGVVESTGAIGGLKVKFAAHHHLDPICLKEHDWLSPDAVHPLPEFRAGDEVEVDLGDRWAEARYVGPRPGCAQHVVLLYRAWNSSTLWSFDAASIRHPIKTRTVELSTESLEEIKRLAKEYEKENNSSIVKIFKEIAEQCNDS